MSGIRRLKKQGSGVSSARHPSAAGPVNTFRLALRFLRRDWRAGEMRVLMAALVIGVGSVTTVGFFTARIDRAMQSQASELLAADLLVASPDPIDETFALAAQRRGLAVVRTLNFRSVIAEDDQFQLAEIKAVSKGYPLRGSLRVAPAPFAEDQPTDEVPASGTVWLDPRLMSVLDLSIGDQINLGAANFTVTNVLTYEPDRGGNLFALAPRLLMNREDVVATQLVQPGSRVTHQLLVAGEPAPVSTFRRWLDGALGPNERIETVRDARPEIRTALDRAKQFLGLASLVSVLLAGVAIAVASRRHAERHLDPAAVIRCLGASQGTIAGIFLGELLVGGLLAGLVGCAVGYLAQTLLATLLGELFLASLPPPSWTPVATGLLTGMVTLLGFALPPLLRLKDVAPARVLRRELGSLPPRSWSIYGSALAALAVLVYWQGSDAVLASYVLGGGTVTLLVLAGTALLLVKTLSMLRSRVGVAWRFGLSNIARRANGSLVQVVAFGLGMTVLLLLTLVRADLLEDWQRRLPPNAPNFFLINVQPEEVPGVRSFLAARELSDTALYPMVRGRLEAIDGRAVSPEDYGNPRAQRLVAREFNLSWAERLQKDNQIVQGHWWNTSEFGRPLFSVEQELAQTLGITLGDSLTFQVAGRKVSGTVRSLRSVEWDSFQPNFFVLAPPGLLETYPATYITSFFLPEHRRALLAQLIRQYPSVTVLDVNALMSKVRELMERATLAVEYVFLFTLLAGISVLYAAIQSTLDERRFETAIVRTLGADRRRILVGLAAEFVTLGLLAGILAALAATAMGHVLATQVFELTYRVDPWVWLYGLGGGAIGIGLAGLLGTRSVLQQPPLQSLREP